MSLRSPIYYTDSPGNVHLSGCKFSFSVDTRALALYNKQIFYLRKEVTAMKDYRQETICVQGGYTPGNGEPRQIPIVQSTTFRYATSEDMGKLFDLEASGYF